MGRKHDGSSDWVSSPGIAQGRELSAQGDRYYRKEPMEKKV